MPFVTAYNTAGEKVRVPAQWVGHPKLGPDLSLDDPTRHGPKPRKQSRPQSDGPQSDADKAPVEPQEKEIENAEDYR